MRRGWIGFGLVLVGCSADPPQLPSGDTAASTGLAESGDPTAGSDVTTSGAATSDTTRGSTSDDVDSTGVETGVAPTCGNGMLDPGEACDPEAPTGRQCADVDAQYLGGALGCDASCNHDTTGCFACGTGPAPSAVGCPPECSRCVGDVCILDCVGGLACEEQKITCPDGLPCQVQCGDIDACLGSTILCPAEHACDVTCDGNSTCMGATILCGAGPCTVQCAGTDGACENTSVACGVNSCSANCGDAGSAAPVLDCDAACDCAPCD